MCRMLVIATILSPRSYRYQTSYLLLFHLSFYLLVNLWGCAPFLMGLCPLSFPGALLPASAHSAVSTATIVRVSRRLYRSIVLSTFLSHPLPTSWCPVARLPAQFGAMSQPSRPATPGPSVTGIVVTLAVLRRLSRRSSSALHRASGRRHRSCGGLL